MNNYISDDELFELLRSEDEPIRDSQMKVLYNILFAVRDLRKEHD